MDLIKELKALMPDEPESEISKDVDEFRQSNPGITDEQIFEKGKNLLQGMKSKAGSSTLPSPGMSPVIPPPSPGAPNMSSPAARGSAGIESADIIPKDRPGRLGGRDVAIAALEGIAGLGDAISTGYGGVKTDYLKTAMGAEQQNKENRLAREKLISDRLKEQRTEKRDDETLRLANLKTQAETMKATMEAMRGDGKDRFEMEEKLRDGFSGASKTFAVVRDQYGTLQAAAKDPSAAGDLALIFSYMKLVDPGSTVREGEFSNAQNSAGVPDRVRNLYNNALNGQRFAPSVRSDFVNQAGKLFQSHKQTFDATKGLYDKLAASYNLDPKKVTDIVVGESSGRGEQGQKESNPNTPPQPSTKQMRSFSREDEDALKWANENPKDPRAVEIHKRLGR